MESVFQGLPFGPADILLPRACEFTRWSVVACDQYTSQPEYWERVAQFVGDAPSALHLILPEGHLEGPNVKEEIQQINATMEQYLEEEQFTCYPNALIYVERTLDSGAVRKGLVGLVDLDQYHYDVAANAPIRATEGTVLSRIPPRMAVRREAAVELPHIMLLADDPERTMLEPLAEQKAEMQLVYDFALMERGGQIKGWLLSETQQNQVAQAMRTLKEQMKTRNPQCDLLFAVGDGNHSLATAKACYEEQKKQTPSEQWDSLPSRYALCELVNLYDDSLEFEAIHRVVFGVEPEALLEAMQADAGTNEVLIPYSYGAVQGTVTVSGADGQLPVGILQDKLDAYLANAPESRIDYIHGEDVTIQLAQQPGAIGFVLPPMEKAELFPAVIQGGVLPRKTFSMGEAHDKRFYLEARKIRK